MGDFLLWDWGSQFEDFQYMLVGDLFLERKAEILFRDPVTTGTTYIRKSIDL